MCNESALGISKLLNQHNNILCQLVEVIVGLVWRSLRVSISSHVDGDHTIVLTELPDLVAPREPELERFTRTKEERRRRWVGWER